jgi:hypothetical protein
VYQNHVLLKCGSQEKFSRHPKKAMVSGEPRAGAGLLLASHFGIFVTLCSVVSTRRGSGDQTRKSQNLIG